MENTFIQDFLIAERCYADISSKEAAIKDTFDRSTSWLYDVEMFSELVIALNRLCWHHYENGDQELSEIYSDLFYEARDMGFDYYVDDDFDYFYNKID